MFLGASSPIQAELHLLWLSGARQSTAAGATSCHARNLHRTNGTEASWLAARSKTSLDRCGVAPAVLAPHPRTYAGMLKPNKCLRRADDDGMEILGITSCPRSGISLTGFNHRGPIQ